VLSMCAGVLCLSMAKEGWLVRVWEGGWLVGACAGGGGGVV